MQYSKFTIKNYRAIKGPLKIDLKNKIVPLVGINECGKTTILQAIFAFDIANDNLNKSKQIQNIGNLYALEDDTCEIEASINIYKEELINIIENLITYNKNSKIKNEAKQEELEQTSQEWKKFDIQNQKIIQENDIYAKLIQILKDKVKED